jgi:hypothetical protein
MSKVLLFLLFCFPARLLLAYIAKTMSLYYLPLFSIITFIIGILFIKNYITNEPKVGFFGSKVWWSNYRLVHGINYLFFSIMAFFQYKNAWIFLLCDALLGLIFFIYEQYIINYRLVKAKKDTSKKDITKK